MIDNVKQEVITLLKVVYDADMCNVLGTNDFIQFSRFLTI